MLQNNKQKSKGTHDCKRFKLHVLKSSQSRNFKCQQTVGRRTTYKRQRQSWGTTGQEISSAGRLGECHSFWNRHSTSMASRTHPPVSRDPEIQSIIHQWASDHCSSPTPVTNTSDHSISTSDHCLSPPVGWISNPCPQDEDKHTQATSTAIGQK